MVTQRGRIYPLKYSKIYQKDNKNSQTMKQQMSNKKKNRILQYIFFLYLKLFIPTLQEARKDNKKQETHWLTRVCSVSVKSKHHMEFYLLILLPF